MNFIERARNFWKKNIVGQGTSADFGTDIDPSSTNKVSDSEEFEIELPEQPYTPEEKDTLPSYITNFFKDFAQTFGINVLIQVLKHVIEKSKK